MSGLSMSEMSVITKEQLSTWPEVVEAVNANGGVNVVTMETLRDIDGYGRLGSTVRASIKKKLATIGLGTIRDELPSEGSAPLLIFRLGTPAGHLIEQLHSLSTGETKDMTYLCEALRNFNEVPNAHEVKEAIGQAVKALERVA